MKITPITIILTLSLLLFIFGSVELSKRYTTENINYKKEFKALSTEDLYKVWNETSIGTDIHHLAWKELDNRGYWDKKRNKNELEAIEIVNKYIK